ncbi:MAG: class I SAM-dependent methyltransferase [Rhodospirillales bacterium]|nr:class I SAM-dependent methyltransferase [Rhodospirillales bacterium]
MHDTALPHIRTAVRHETECKICRQPAVLDGLVDFNKSAEEAKGKFLPLSGIPVYYHKCTACGLIFTVSFDEWSKDDFLRYIYNDQYHIVDPDYLHDRPANNANLVFNFTQPVPHGQILDYGGGNGKLAQILSERGRSAHSWDPMENDAAHRPSSIFDVVTCFEVLEHTPTPIGTFREILSCLNERGVVLFSTLAVNLPDRQSANLWYVAPRNGHVTIYSRKSLDLLAGMLGYRMHHFNDLLHLCYREPPAWLAR